MKQHPSRLALIVAIPLVVLAAWPCCAIYDWIRVGYTIKLGVSSPTATTPRAFPTPRTPREGATPVPGYATTWYGNSFGGAVNGRGPYADGSSGPGVTPGVFVQHITADLTVTPAGLIAANAYWNEGHRTMGLYQNGLVVGILPCEYADYTAVSGFAIANNGTYIYATNVVYSGSGSVTPGNFIKRYTITGAASTFSGGGGGCGNRLTVDAGGVSQPIWGLAASSTELYAADGQTNSIQVYDSNAMTRKRSFAFANPKRIAFDPTTSTLWISQGSGNSFAGNVYHYDLNGNQLSGTITDVGRPSALQMHNGHLWVADSGRDQQIKIYNSAGVKVGTFGVQGGIVSGTPGVWAANKLHRPNGIGFDNSGNIYIVGGIEGAQLDTDLRAFNSSGTLLWHLDGQQWVDGGVIDESTDGQDMYTQFDHDKFDYSRLTIGMGGGGQEWSFYANGTDRYDYPYDLRGGYTYAFAIRTIGGMKYLATSNMFGQHIELFHMVGEIAKPMLILQSKGYSNNNDNIPNKPGGVYYWYDTNNNGIPDAGEFTTPSQLTTDQTACWDFDSNGDIWWVNDAIGPNGSGGTLNRMPRTGTNGNGQLTYGSIITYSGVPAPFIGIQNSKYVSATDTLYVSGYTAAHPRSANEFGSLQGTHVAGTVVARYNNFLSYWAAHGSWPPAAWSTAWLYNIPSATPWGRAIRPWTVAGNRLFAAPMVSTGLKDQHPYYKGPVIHNIYVYDTANGNFLGEMMPGVEDNYIGWQDGNLVLQAYQRSTGEYVVTEEEQVSGHVTVLRGMLNNFTQY